jgi:predicted XRE-type DNA-binding protein
MKTQLPEKASFKKKGWSYRSAAPVLGVTYQYLSDVMNGKFSSRRLTKKIRALPLREKMISTGKSLSA